MADKDSEPQEGKDGKGAAAKAASGLSAFITRILEQLSLSAWLPAAMLVGNLAMLVQLHAQPKRSLGEAVKALRDKPAGVLIPLVFSIVLVTMVTQAFEFEVIRVLEGYWGTSWLAKPLASLCTARQRRRREGMHRRYKSVQLKAYHRAGIPSS